MAQRHCEELDHVGYDDWRLPTLWEVHRLVDVDREGPYIDDTVFQRLPGMGSGAWTTTLDRFQMPLVVNFSQGFVDGERGDEEFAAFCVRRAAGP
jgi:hypothetical protein